MDDDLNRVLSSNNLERDDVEYLSEKEIELMTNVIKIRVELRKLKQELLLRRRENDFEKKKPSLNGKDEESEESGEADGFDSFPSPDDFPQLEEDVSHVRNYRNIVSQRIENIDVSEYLKNQQNSPSEDREDEVYDENERRTDFGSDIVGFCSFGNTCHVNSCLQLLLQIPKLIRHANQNQNIYTYEFLNKISRKYQNEKLVQKLLKQFITFLKEESIIKAGIQEDPIFVLNGLSSKMIPPPLCLHWRWSLSQSCKECQRIKYTKRESCIVFSLDFCGLKQSSFRSFFSSLKFIGTTNNMELFLGSERKECCRCQIETEHTKKMVFHSIPEYMLVHANQQKDASFRTNENVEFYNRRYKLVGCILKTEDGFLTVAHVKKEGGWIQCTDTEIIGIGNNDRKYVENVGIECKKILVAMYKRVR